MNRVVILDNEAVQALLATGHKKHREILRALDAVTSRKGRPRGPRQQRLEPTTLVVPTSVRVEAGWDRTSATAGFANGLAIHDSALDGHDANVAAALRQRLGTAVSVADAHLGATIARYAGGHITVLTSDPSDVGALAGATPVNIITL